MLVNFIFSNYRSYLKENIFSLQATYDSLYENSNTFSVSESLLGKDENRLLKSAVLFGPNASGKSNFLKAFQYMQMALNASRQSKKGMFAVDLEQYLYLRTSNQPVSKFQVDFIINEIYYEYSFTIQKNKILSERLDKRAKNNTSRLSKICTLFNRVNNEIIDGVYKNDLTDIVEIRDEVLLVSVGKDMKTKFIEDFNNVYYFFETAETEIDGVFNEEHLKFLQENKDLALKILKESDIGLSDIEVLDEKLDVNEKEFDLNKLDILHKLAAQKNLTGMLIGQNLKNKEFHLFDIITKFNIYDENYNIVDTYNTTIFGNHGFNSQGTEKLLKIIGVILSTLNSGGTLFIDEADANLHYYVAKFIIDLFNSPYNKKNAQLIIVAHNPLIMETTLRKDQIYFVEKEKFGESNIFSLAEFKNVRKEHSIYKRYLAGYYKAIPSIKLDNFAGDTDEETS